MSKKRQMWVHDEFIQSVKKKAKEKELSMIEYTRSLCNDLEHKNGKKKKHY